MSGIINKSNHPVEIKKIDIRMWCLRDEIEAAIAQRIQEDGHENHKDVDIEDIREFYINILNADIGSEHDEDETDEDEDDSNLDSSGNPLDDDALAMMAALGGAQEESTEVDDAEAEAQEEEDDEAAALAAQMLADQGMGAESSEGEDDEAAALAAQMLADQGAGEEQQGPSKKVRAPFKRVVPEVDKITTGFLFLTDIQMDQVMLFSQGGFLQGQNVVVELLVPKPFNVLAEVLVSMNIGRNSKVLSPTKPEYRIHAKFNHKFPNDAENLRKFLKSVEPDIPTSPKKLKKPDAIADDDDFDDLGF